ncbi:hypothetical protein [Actinopolyspora mortivallis]|uniref:hypothetical protein n=1 Tax=Actinopolyspora mortivallis TaxID=33906 RepID=UPI00036CBE02|nr:hypothetical protein [Actinopolyspora mortivallis]
MSGPSAAAGLAGLLTQGQWLLEQTAYEVGGRRATAGQCREVAEALDELAAALREHAETRETAPATGENSASHGGTDV